MARQLKPHVIVERYQTGGFFVERTIICRCGWRATHYNAGHLKELFAEHKASTQEITDSAVSP